MVREPGGILLSMFDEKRWEKPDSIWLSGGGGPAEPSSLTPRLLGSRPQLLPKTPERGSLAAAGLRRIS